MKKTTKTIFIAIAVLALAFVIYLIVKSSLRKEADLSFPETVVVENITGKEVDKIIKALVYNVFNYDTLKISVGNIPAHMSNFGDIEIKAFILKNNFVKKEYFIFLNTELNPGEYMNVLSHEMVHLYQFERGDLVQIGNGEEAIMMYKGDTLNYQETEYEKRPHEIEAFKLQGRVLRDLERVFYE